MDQGLNELCGSFCQNYYQTVKKESFSDAQYLYKEGASISREKHTSTDLKVLLAELEQLHRELKGQIVQVVTLAAVHDSLKNTIVLTVVAHTSVTRREFVQTLVLEGHNDPNSDAIYWLIVSDIHRYIPREIPPQDTKPVVVEQPNLVPETSAQPTTAPAQEERKTRQKENRRTNKNSKNPSSSKDQHNDTHTNTQADPHQSQVQPPQTQHESQPPQKQHQKQQQQQHQKQQQQQQQQQQQPQTSNVPKSWSSVVSTSTPAATTATASTVNSSVATSSVAQPVAAHSNGSGSAPLSIFIKSVNPLTEESIREAFAGVQEIDIKKDKNVAFLYFGQVANPEAVLSALIENKPLVGGEQLISLEKLKSGPRPPKRTGQRIHK